MSDTAPLFNSLLQDFRERMSRPTIEACIRAVTLARETPGCVVKITVKNAFEGILAAKTIGFMLAELDVSVAPAPAEYGIGIELLPSQSIIQFAVE